MSRDTSPQARIALAKRLWQLTRTDPSELCEMIHTNNLAGEILQTGLRLFIQQAQSQARISGKEDEYDVELEEEDQDEYDANEEKKRPGQRPAPLTSLADEVFVSLPLYEWDLLAILLEVSAQHALSCRDVQDIPSGAPAWIPIEQQCIDEQAVTQPRQLWHELIILLDRLCEHFAETDHHSAQFAQWVPDLEMRRALMKRASDFNDTPESYTEDLEHKKTYQDETLGGLIWYMARRIEVQITR